MDEREKLEMRSYVEMEVSKVIDEFLVQEPHPSPVTIADFFGMYNLVKRNYRRNSTEINIPSLKAALVDQILDRVQTTGKSPQIPEAFDFFDRVLVPPGEGEIIAGSGGGVPEKEVIPRTQYLTEFLKANNIQYDKPFGGKNSPTMMRGVHTYFTYYLPELRIAILVNNQEGNATFIFYNVSDKPEAININALKKEEYSDPSKNFYPFRQLNWTGDRGTWQVALLDYLNAPISGSVVSGKEQRGEAIAPQRKGTEAKIALLEEAYQVWKNLSQSERGKFNPTWLSKNGYIGLYQWTFTNGGIDNLVAQASAELQNDFEKKQRTKEGYTTKTAVEKLKMAYQTWKKISEAKHFFKVWLKENEKDLCYWAHTHGGLDTLIERAPEDIKVDFSKTEVETTEIGTVEVETTEKFEKAPQPYGQPAAVAKLEEAYKNWQALPESIRGAFNINWLIKNGYWGLYRWSLRRVSMDTLVAASSQGVRENFKKGNVY